MKIYKSLNIMVLAMMIALAPSCRKDDPDGPKPGPDPVVPVISDGNSFVTYEVLVYSFCDSGKDGIGDIKGVTSKVEYLRRMGFSAILLSPIFTAGSYHGYDATDYTAIDPVLGTESDLRELVAAAHDRNMSVYMDLELNQASVDHFMFQEAQKNASSQYRKYFIFSQDPQKDIDEGKIPMFAGALAGEQGYIDAEWYPAGTADEKFHSSLADARYADWNFGSVQTCESSGAFKMLASAADKWINLGIDGFRLNNVHKIYHSLYSDENAAFIRKFYDHCNATYKAKGAMSDIRMIADARTFYSATFFAGMKECGSPVFWGDVRAALELGTGAAFVDNIVKRRSEYAGYRSDFVWATSLSSHDEDRAASTLNRNLDKAKLAAAVLLTSPGAPIVYQGEELGYWGLASGDREYVRTPVKWEADGKVAGGRLNGKVDYDMLATPISVDTQYKNPASLLNVYRSFANLRVDYPALSRGQFAPVKASSPAIAAWTMTYQTQRMLVLHNFSGATVSETLEGFSLAKPMVDNGSISVSGSTVTMGALSSVVYLLD